MVVHDVGGDSEGEGAGQEKRKQEEKKGGHDKEKLRQNKERSKVNRKTMTREAFELKPKEAISQKRNIENLSWTKTWEKKTEQVKEAWEVGGTGKGKTLPQKSKIFIREVDNLLNTNL